MKRNLLSILLTVGMLLVISLACSFSASTANIDGAWMARDEAGEQKTDIFAQDEIFYCKVDLANAPDETTVKAAWTAVNVEGEDPDLFLDETELTTGSNILTFELSNNSLWPIGSYKVDLYLNDELDQILEFEVK